MLPVRWAHTLCCGYVGPRLWPSHSFFWSSHSKHEMNYCACTHFYCSFAFLHYDLSLYFLFPSYWDIGKDRPEQAVPDQRPQKMTSDQGLQCLPFIKHFSDTPTGYKMSSSIFKRVISSIGAIIFKLNTVFVVIYVTRILPLASIIVFIYFML